MGDLWVVIKVSYDGYSVSHMNSKQWGLMGHQRWRAQLGKGKTASKAGKRVNMSFLYDETYFSHWFYISAVVAWTVSEVNGWVNRGVCQSTKATIINGSSPYYLGDLWIILGQYLRKVFHTQHKGFHFVTYDFAQNYHLCRVPLHMFSLAVWQFCKMYVDHIHPFSPVPPRSTSNSLIIKLYMYVHMYSPSSKSM